MVQNRNDTPKTALRALKYCFNEEMDIRYGFSDPQNPIKPTASEKNAFKNLAPKIQNGG